MDKTTIDFLYEIRIMILPVKRHKNNAFKLMISFVKDLVAGREDTNDNVEKIAIYDDLRRFIEGSNPWAVCYDMELYVALYKYATTCYRREYAKKLIDDTIVDDFIGDEGIVDNFMHFVVMKDFLYEDDVKWFDSQCMSVLTYFSNRVKKSKKPKKSHVVSLDSRVQDEYLRKVAETVKSMEMTEMRSYEFACKVLA